MRTPAVTAALPPRTSAPVVRLNGPNGTSASAISRAAASSSGKKRAVTPSAAQHFPKVGQRLFHRPAEEYPAGGGEHFREQRDAVAFRRRGRTPGKRLLDCGDVTPARRGKPAEQRLPLVHRVTPRR